MLVAGPGVTSSSGLIVSPDLSKLRGGKRL
jgi:hypothetical protein